MKQLRVTKRDGSLQDLDLNRFHRVVSWACEGLSGVSASEIEIRSRVQFYDKIKTKDIHETLIKAASELIDEDTPNYQYVASRLINYALRKEVYGGPEPIDLQTHVNNVVAAGYYDRELIFDYDVSDFDALQRHIDHDRDFEIAYAGMEQFRGK